MADLQPVSEYLTQDDRERIFRIFNIEIEHMILRTSNLRVIPDDKPVTRKRRRTDSASEQHTADQSRGERAGDAASSSGAGDRGEASVRGQQTSDADLFRKQLEKYEAGDLSISGILQLIEETKLNIRCFMTEIMQGFKNQLEEHNALFKVDQIRTATFNNIDEDDEDLQPSAEYVEQLKFEDHRHVTQKALRNELRQIIAQLKSQIHDGRLLMEDGELREIKLQISKKIKELEDLQPMADAVAETGAGLEAGSPAQDDRNRIQNIRNYSRRMSNRLRAQIHVSSLKSMFKELREIMLQFPDRFTDCVW
ncbi:uncharacterized protein [Pseudorasbora parva]|uniref:uncharacterized protein n=1 Tax=Pseudorasbora parva TaxID=51549 RepID=UPI00351DB4EB